MAITFNTDTWVLSGRVRYSTLAKTVVLSTAGGTGYVAPVAGDIGKQVTDDGVPIGPLLTYYGNTLVVDTLSIVAVGSVIAIVSGTGAGTESVFGAYGYVYDANAIIFDFFRNDAVSGDNIVFGVNFGHFQGLLFDVGTPLVADAITVVWEYGSNDFGWFPLTGVIDETNGFQNIGANTVTWTIPPSWQTQYPYGTGHGGTGVGGYLVRARISSVTNITEGGANATTSVVAKDYAITVTGTGNTLALIKSANDVGGWGVVSQVERYFFINCNLRFGNALAMDFTINDSQFLQLGNASYDWTWWSKYTQNTFNIGRIGTKGTYGGANLLLYLNWDQSVNYMYGAWNVYNSKIHKSSSTRKSMTYNFSLSGVCDFQGCILSHDSGDKFQFNCSGTLKNCIIDDGSGTDASYFYMYGYAILDNVMFTSMGAILQPGWADHQIENIRFGTTRTYLLVYGPGKGVAKNCEFAGSYSAQCIGYLGGTAYAQYDLELTFLDEDGNTLTGVTVVFTDTFGTILFNGVWSSTLPVNVYKRSDALGSIYYSPFNLVVSKNGYVTQEYSTDVTYITRKKTIVINRTKPVILTDGGLLISTNPSLGGRSNSIRVIP